MTFRIVTRRHRVLRRVAVAGLAAGLATLGIAVLPVVASAAPDERDSGGEPAFAAFEDATITPGVVVASPAGNCTSSFVFADGKDVFLSLAAHCVTTEDAGQTIDGCVEPVLPVGTDLKIIGNDRREYAGRLAYSSWAAMQKNGEANRATCENNDFALVELDPADVGSVNPSVPLFGGPTGLDLDGTESGERVVSYQPNIHPATPAKQGVSMGQPDGPRNHLVATNPPSERGDSGSGYMDEDGKAFGVLSFGFAEGSSAAGIDGAADIALALEYAVADGDFAKVELVPGTVPFSVGDVQMTPLPSLPLQLPVGLTPVPL